ncbi:hypothetical protein E2C01_024388 [Portunus trituberculatus]|uniref:Uncharacterized protein n=1 Tax=Portunus trituberculatus TaxID=210409 RepID=A0A5B7ECP7_PORTR|nr:hypothetical protein [Portunus trituberculatus]
MGGHKQQWAELGAGGRVGMRGIDRRRAGVVGTCGRRRLLRSLLISLSSSPYSIICFLCLTPFISLSSVLFSPLPARLSLVAPATKPCYPPPPPTPLSLHPPSLSNAIPNFLHHHHHHHYLPTYLPHPLRVYPFPLL